MLTWYLFYTWIFSKWHDRAYPVLGEDLNSLTSESMAFKLWGSQEVYGLRPIKAIIYPLLTVYHSGKTADRAVSLHPFISGFEEDTYTETVRSSNIYTKPYRWVTAMFSQAIPNLSVHVHTHTHTNIKTLDPSDRKKG